MYNLKTNYHDILIFTLTSIDIREKYRNSPNVFPTYIILPRLINCVSGCVISPLLGLYQVISEKSLF